VHVSLHDDVQENMKKRAAKQERDLRQVRCHVKVCKQTGHGIRTYRNAKND
jgi:hypothetical protein